MSNGEILNLVKEEFNIVDAVGGTILRIKDEDTKARIDGLLRYMDCEAYNEHAREGFRIFAKRLKEIL